ncbi:hypothetical protein [Acidisphaera sp. S103]|uniref:hypothetical protein n=1 Tax=Acidisphaera sp. S103 TaxID=1747223 RepID=UPI00131CCC66|nr:hypothetical protein [Acidisphaera sp. S103]
MAQWRERGHWPGCYDELWTHLQGWHGKQNGTRAMVAVLAPGPEFGHDRLRTAVATTVSLGACDVAAVRYLLTEAGLRKAKPKPIDVGALLLASGQHIASQPSGRRYAALAAGSHLFRHHSVLWPH